MSNSDPAGPSHPPPPATLQSQSSSGEPPLVPGPQGAMVRANAIDNATGRYTWIPPEHLPAQHPPPPRPLPESPYGPVSSAPVGVPGSTNATLGIDTDRESGVVAEAVRAGPRISEGANGERRIEPETSGPGGGFTAVNN